jgi:hypothetical protein
MQLKIESIENEMDMRVKSLILQIQKYHENYKSKLVKYKDDFQK